MHCQECGTLMPADSRYCRMCGAFLLQKSTAELAGQAAEASAGSLLPPAPELPPSVEWDAKSRRRHRRHRPWYQHLAAAITRSWVTIANLMFVLAAILVILMLVVRR